MSPGLFRRTLQPHPMQGMLFDNHCHLTDPAFDPDSGGLLRPGRGAGWWGWCQFAPSPTNALAALALGPGHRGHIWATVGIIPIEASADSPASHWMGSGVLDGSGTKGGAAGRDRAGPLSTTIPPGTPQRRFFRVPKNLGAGGESMDLPVVVHLQGRRSGNVRPSSGTLLREAGGPPLLSPVTGPSWMWRLAGVVVFLRKERKDSHLQAFDGGICSGRCGGPPDCWRTTALPGPRPFRGSGMSRPT